MPTQMKKVKSIEVAGQGKTGNDYWKVTWDDDKTDMVFDFTHFSILEEAQAKNANVEIEKIKKPGKDGKEYWNIKTLKIIESGKMVKEIEKEGGKIESVTTKDTGKNKSYALSYAKDIGVAMIVAGKEFSTKKVLEIAKEFNSYLDGDSD